MTRSTDPGDGFGPYVEVSLTRGKAVRVSPEDERWVGQHRWKYNGDRSPYAARVVRVDKGKRRTVYLHRLIVHAPPGRVVNHRNGLTLDCRRPNLHVVTGRANSTLFRVNQGRVRFTGVWCRTPDPKPTRRDFRAAITAGEERLFLGSFHTPEDAARAYDMKSVELFGLHAITNFPLAEYVCPGIEQWGAPPQPMPDPPF